MTKIKKVKAEIVPSGEEAGHNQCPTCYKEFSFISGFDRHRTGSYKERTRRCLSTEEMKKLGMKEGKLGRWFAARRGDSSWVRKLVQNLP